MLCTQYTCYHQKVRMRRVFPSFLFDKMLDLRRTIARVLWNIRNDLSLAFLTPHLVVFLRDSIVKYQLARRLCDRSDQSRATVARSRSGFLPVVSVSLLRSAVLLGTILGRSATQSVIRRANERIPCRTRVEGDPCVRSILLEARPCALRNQAPAAQLQRGLHAPQRSRDYCRIKTAAAWRLILYSREEIHQERDYMMGTAPWRDGAELGESVARSSLVETRLTSPVTKSSIFDGHDPALKYLLKAR